MTAVPADPVRHARLQALARGLRRRHLLAAMRAGSLRGALPLAVPAVLLVWLWPAWWPPAALVVAAGAALGSLAAAWRARGITDVGLLRAADGAVDKDERAELERLGSGLATWLEQAPPAAVEPVMLDWLARDLERDFGALPVATWRRVGRRRLGRLRWLLLAVILLLLAWLLSFWWQPPWAGLLGGKPDVVSTPPAVVPGADVQPLPSQGGAGDQPPQTTDIEPEPGSAPPDPEPEPDPDEPDAELPPPEEPAPLLPLPPQQLFAVPEFVGDGPTTRVKAHVAEVAGGGAPDTPVARQGSGGEAEQPPEPEAETFARAAERARQARHVPDAERAMVRRFFTLLREAAK